MGPQTAATCPTSKGANDTVITDANAYPNLSDNPGDTPKSTYEEPDPETYAFDHSDHNLEDWPDSCWGGAW